MAFTKKWTQLCFLASTLPFLLHANCDHVSLSGEYLFWWSCPDSVYVGHRCVFEERIFDFVDNSDPNKPIDRRAYTKNKQKGKRTYLPYEGNSGFRLGASYHCYPCRYDANISWTHFSPKIKKSMHVCPEEKLFPMATNVGFETPNILTFLTFIGNEFQDIEFKSVKGTWDLNLNWVDIDVGHHFTNYWCIPFRTHMGLRIASVDQRFRLKTLSDLILPDGSIGGDIALEKRWRENSNSVGPRFGITVDQALFCGFGYYVHAAASLVYGKNEASLKEHGERLNLTNPDFESPNFFSKSTNDRYCIKTITDLGVGLFWKAAFCGETRYVTLSMGWEHHYLVNYGVTDADFVEFFYPQEDQDLSLQGLTVTVQVGF